VTVPDAAKHTHLLGQRRGHVPGVPTTARRMTPRDTSPTTHNAFQRKGVGDRRVPRTARPARSPFTAKGPGPESRDNHRLRRGPGTPGAWSVCDRCTWRTRGRPELPSTVTAVYADGTTARVEVRWKSDGSSLPGRHETPSTATVSGNRASRRPPWLRRLPYGQRDPRIPTVVPVGTPPGLPANGDHSWTPTARPTSQPVTWGRRSRIGVRLRGAVPGIRPGAGHVVARQPPPCGSPSSFTPKPERSRWGDQFRPRPERRIGRVLRDSPSEVPAGMLDGNTGLRRMVQPVHQVGDQRAAPGERGARLGNGSRSAGPTRSG